jgi:cation/acetate symporter
MISALAIILTSPDMYVQYKLNPATALHSLNQPGIVSIPLSFITLVIISLLTQKKNQAR